MSAEFPYIDVAVRYDHGGSMVTMFTCPQGAAARIPAIDGRNITQKFANFTTGYVISPRRNKLVFTLLHAESPSAPVLAVTVALDSDVLLPGRLIVKLLNELKSQLGETDRLSEPTVNHLIRAIGFPAAPLRRPCEQPNTASGTFCYRTYVSPTELNRILTFPRQPQYEGYADIVVVPPTTVALDSGLTRLQGMPQALLAVVCPKGVTAQSSIAPADKPLTLTYSMDHFLPVDVTFTPDEPNCYAVIQGPALVVKDALHAGIDFRSEPCKCEVTTPDGTPLRQFSITVNGHPADTDGDSIILRSSDFHPSGTASLSVSSTNFIAATRSISAAGISPDTPLRFTLEQEESSVLLRLNFSDGRILEQRIAVGKSSPEYCQLRAGNFHGFRAHKLASPGAETYNVDMTAPAAPTAMPGAEPAKPARQAAKSEPQPRPEAKPEPEKPQPSPEPKKPVQPEIVDFSHDADITDDPELSSDSKPRKKLIFTIAGIALAVVVAGALVWYLPKALGSAGTDDEQVDTAASIISERVDTVTPQPGGAAAPADGQPATAPTEATPAAAAANPTGEAADVEYLNKSKVWKRSDLQSDKYRALYDAITSGNIGAMANNAYFATSGQATNTMAVKVMDAAWGSIGTGTQKANERELKKMEKAGQIDLAKLFDNLARFRDKEPNKTPRPGTK